MPKYKTDAQILDEYLPKLKAFTDERLTAENAERLYNFMKPYNYDKGGWIIYNAAKDLLNTDVYSEFPAEDNLGYFENLDGYGLLRWLEIAKFADKEYERLTGGYELLKTHSFDTESPKYKDYQAALYTAAVTGIIDRLTEKQPYLIPVFYNRLSYIDIIFGKGFPTRDDLNDKIDREAKTLNDEGEKAVKGRALSENLEKMNFRNILYSMPMTDETVQALYIKDNVLDELYVQSFEFQEIGDYYDYVSDYLEREEHDYLAERVYDRVTLEYEDYKDEVKTWPPEKIIEEAAYKLTVFDDIQTSLDPETSDFSTEQLKALWSLSSPLWDIYHEWQDRDDSRMDELTDTIRDAANERAKENTENSYETDFGSHGLDEEAEDGLEP